MENVRKISKKYYLREIVACFLVSCLFFNAPVALAEVVPTGSVPGTGTVTVTPLGVGTHQDMTATDGVIGNFSDFDIDTGHTVDCVNMDALGINPSNSANALFKVFSGDGTQILGSFTANGNIYLYDGAGIFVGASGIVNANRFIASSLDITQGDWEDFIDGTIDKLKFGPLGVEDLRSAVENQGTITAPDGVYLVGAQVLNSGTIDSDLVVMAAGEKVYLTHGDSKVYVETPSDLFTPDPAFNKVDNSGTIDAGAQVLLAAGDIFSTAMNVSSLAATANRDITLTGAVQTEGDMELAADFDGSGGATGGTMWAQSTLISTTGSIDISASDDTIDLDADVTADVDLTLNNDTMAADGITLTAGQNVDIATGKILTAEGSLEIEATAGEIMADTSIIDMPTSGEPTLTLTQNAGMDLEQDFTVGNRSNTDLVANSTGGSVTSEAAGEWNSISGHAAENITLSDIGEDITTKGLATDEGDIKVTAYDGKVNVRGPIDAGQDVIITATDEGTDGSEDAIFLYGAEEGGRWIVAGGDIWLNNNTWAADAYLLDAGQDVRVGWQGEQNPWDPAGGYYAPKTLTGEGALTIEADRDITLGGDVTAGTAVAGNLILKADAESIDSPPGDDIGNMTALGNVINENGNIDIYASDNTIIITGDKVEGSGDVTLHANTILNGGSQTIEATSGTLITDDGVNVDKSTAGNVDFVGGSGIELGGNVTATGMTGVDTMTFKNDVTANGTDSQRIDAGLGTLVAQDGVDIDKTTAGSLDLGGDVGIELGGNVRGTGMTASDAITFEDDVTANGTGTQRLDADAAALWAKGTITKTTTGDLALGGDAGVDLDGTVHVQDGSLTIEDDFSAAGDLLASENVTFEGSMVDAILDGEGDQWIRAAYNGGTGTLTASGWVWKVTPGDLFLRGNNEDGKAIDLQFAGCLPAASTSLGNLDLFAENGDIQISGDLTTFGFSEEGPSICNWYDRPTGGVRIIAENGKIYTEGATVEVEPGVFADALNISIVGNSDHLAYDELHDRDGLGVDLPWLDEGEEGKAAIVVLSRDDLVFGPDTQLIAHGRYYPASPSELFATLGDFGDFFDGYSTWEDFFAGFDFTAFMDALEAEFGSSWEAVFSDEDAYDYFMDNINSILEYMFVDGVVDDRPGVDFLATPGTSIGGVVRDEGDAMDVAIYAGSMGTEEGQGNVHLDGRAIDVEAGGTMVVDAYDTVTFGDFDTFDLSTFEGCADMACALIKLALRFHEDIDFTDLCSSFQDYAGGYDGENLLEDFLNDYFDEGAFFNIDRMEVSSRITEWLFQAVSNGRLPFAGDAAGIAAFEDFIGGEYVLRGAGLGNPGIAALEDGRAWVLEDPILPPPLYREAGQPAEEQEFGEGGCPALMNWLAGELGIEEDQIEVTVANAFASSTDIQPCEMCARLRDAATTLEDAEGTGVASLVQVVNEFVATPTPPSEEQMASIATAFAEHTEDGTYYAAAGEWIDALVEYVGILTFEMGYSAEESTGYANKYIGPATDTGNASLIAYVQARLAALGG